MTAMSTIPWTADAGLEVLSFGLGGETFAIEAVRVEEILDLLPETEVPGARFATAQVSVRPVTAHPGVELAAASTPAGSWSVITTSRASDGPAFWTVISQPIG